ncbi:MAG: triose-phosphate isomerase [bacterium]
MAVKNKNLPIIIANWKMNLRAQERVNLVNQLKKELSSIKGAEIVLCPSFISLQEVGRLIKEANLKLGAQDIFWEEKGAYTGEVSPLMLEEMGCEYVIVGHSERRKYLGETEEMIHKKIRIVLKEKLTPILCIGETFEERQDGAKDYVIMRQMNSALEGIELIDGQKVIIAYEPVWVIGSGQAVQPSEAGQTRDLIRQTLLDLFPIEIINNNFRIIYGGSVNSANVRQFLSEANMDGVLVGGASLKAEEFVGIVKNVI